MRTTLIEVQNWLQQLGDELHRKGVGKDVVLVPSVVTNLEADIQILAGKLEQAIKDVSKSR